MYNFVYDSTYWDKIAETDDFNRVCFGYETEEDFWAFQPDVRTWGLKKDMIFLDVGCGPGRIVKTIAPLVKEYYGVDISKGLISKAVAHYKDYNNVQFFVNDGSTLDFFDSCAFDFVLEYLVFIHLRKDQIVGYIKEIYRVLKPGGIFRLRSFPKKEKYSNGFSFKEMKEIFGIFKEVIVKDDVQKIRYSIQCMK